MISAFFEQRKKFLKTVNDKSAPSDNHCEPTDNVNAVPSRRPWKRCIPTSKINALYPKFTFSTSGNCKDDKP